MPTWPDEGVGLGLVDDPGVGAGPPEQASTTVAIRKLVSATPNRDVTARGLAGRGGREVILAGTIAISIRFRRRLESLRERSVERAIDLGFGA
jgi:hypothetical protein